MFEATRYIAWATKFYGKVPFDLASSGIPLAPWSETGLPVPDVDDAVAADRLRANIARYNDVPVDEVTPALGTSQALFLAYAAVLSPDDEVLVEVPGYEPLTRAAEGLGARVRTFERRADEDFRVVPERVAAAMSPRIRAIVVTSLHNPSGARVDDATVRELAAIADAQGAYVIVDEVYAPFDALPEDGVFRKSARKIAPNVVAVASLTKCYGLGMHRIGWVLGPDAVTDRAAAALVATTGHLPLSYARFAAAAFDAIGPLAARAKALFAGKRAIADAWARSLPDAQWSAPRDGLFGLVTLPGRGDLLPRIEQRARDAGVLVAAGTFFGAPSSFRLSWAACSAEHFEQGLALLEPLVR